MKLFWEYIKSHIGGVLLFLCCAAGACGILFLYTVDGRVIMYCLIFFATVFSIVVAIDFTIFVRKHHRLEAMAKESLYIDQGLPLTGNLIERDYQQIISSLNDLTKVMESEYAKSREKMTEYYATWAHQIKTPIAAARLILQGGDDTYEVRELREELLRIEQYVEMVLCYLKLEGDGSDFLFKECELDGIVRSAVRKFAPQFIRRKIRLTYEGTEVRVLTDEKWLSFVLEQLISNALKYTKVGQVSIAVDENRTLSICDTGIGIAPEDLPRVFERGFTGYNGHTDKKSTGIGLYLCRNICRALGHEISIESNVGEGTTVTVGLWRKDRGMAE